MIVNLILIFCAYVSFTGMGLSWAAQRNRYNKNGKDNRLWIKILDVIFISPLLPWAFLIGVYIRRKKR